MSGQRFTADRSAYLRAYAWMAAIAMAAGMGVLWAMGNPHAWTGAVGGLAAIALRGWYLSSEDLAAEWVLDDTDITGPGERRIALSDIEVVRVLGSSVQIVTKNGHKHLIKYLADAPSVQARIEAAHQEVQE